MIHYKPHYAKIDTNKLTDKHKKALGNDLQGDKVKCDNKVTKDYYEKEYGIWISVK